MKDLIDKTQFPMLHKLIGMSKEESSEYVKSLNDIDTRILSTEVSVIHKALIDTIAPFMGLLKQVSDIAKEIS